mgnify:CR=1 FL=1
MARLSTEDVRKVARLANLKIADGELEEMAAALSDVLGHIAMLEGLNTEKVPPTSHVLQAENVFRKDAAIDRFQKGTALDNAPAKEQGYFSVPRIIE